MIVDQSRAFRCCHAKAKAAGHVSLRSPSALRRGGARASCNRFATVWHRRPPTVGAPLGAATVRPRLQINHCAFSPDARYLATASFDKSVKLWLASNGDFVTTFHGHPAAPLEYPWSTPGVPVPWLTHGRRAVRLEYLTCGSTTSSDGLEQCSLMLLGHVGAVYMVCWSSDSRLVVSASKDSTMKV